MAGLEDVRLVTRNQRELTITSQDEAATKRAKTEFKSNDDIAPLEDQSG